MEKSKRIKWTLAESSQVAQELYRLWSSRKNTEASLINLIYQAQKVLPIHRHRKRVYLEKLHPVLREFNTLAGFDVEESHSKKNKPLKYAWSQEEAEKVAHETCRILDVTGDNRAFMKVVNEAQSVLTRKPKAIRQASDIKHYLKWMAPILIERGYQHHLDKVIHVLKIDRDPVKIHKTTEDIVAKPEHKPQEPSVSLEKPEPKTEPVLPHLEKKPDLAEVLAQVLRPMFKQVLKTAVEDAFNHLMDEVPSMVAEIAKESGKSAPKSTQPENLPKVVQKTVPEVSKQHVVIAGRIQAVNGYYAYLDIEVVTDPTQLSNVVDYKSVLIELTEHSIPVSKVLKEKAGRYYACGRSTEYALRTFLRNLNSQAMLDSIRNKN